MPILTKPRLFLALLPFLAACTFSPTEGILRARVVSAGGVDITVMGPQGFCIDERLVDEARIGAFIFLSDCAANPGEGPSIARVPISAVLTASISNQGLPGADAGMGAALAQLQAFLETPFGQLTLSKSRNPDTLNVLSITRTDNAIYAFIQDTTPTTHTGESPRFWRAFTEVNGRLAALSATGYNAADEEQARIKAILEDFVAAMQAAN